MKYGLIGEKLGHSFSKQIHQMLGNESYELNEIEPSHIDSFMELADFYAINVTIPYKQTVLKYCVVDEETREIGCVNTVVKKGETLYGYNTDHLGFRYMLQQAGIDLAGKSVVLFGSGGTSRTACYVAKKCGAKKVVVLTRGSVYDTDYDNVTFLSYNESSQCEDAQVLINTTPVGMYPDNDRAVTSIDMFKNLEAVVDVIFNPLMTRLLDEAQKRGILYTNGLPMLVAQAFYADLLFKGQDIMLTKNDRELITRIVRTIDKNSRNIVLVGMPGVGKTTVGRVIARRLDREFADTDQMFLDRYGMSAGEYIIKFQEASFREKESEIVCEVAKRTEIVISTGGGSILKSQNRTALRQNAVVVFLDSEPDKLDTIGRPLSDSIDTVRRLYEERVGLYHEVSDIHVVTKVDAEETADMVMMSLRQYQENMYRAFDEQP